MFSYLLGHELMAITTNDLIGREKRKINSTKLGMAYRIWAIPFIQRMENRFGVMLPSTFSRLVPICIWLDVSVALAISWFNSWFSNTLSLFFLHISQVWTETHLRSTDRIVFISNCCIQIFISSHLLIWVRLGNFYYFKASLVLILF